MKKILITLILFTFPLMVFADNRIKLVTTSSSLHGGSSTIVDLKLEVSYGEWGTIDYIKVIGYRNNKSMSSGNVYTPCEEGNCEVTEEREGESDGHIVGYSVNWFGQKLYFKLK